MQKICAKLRLCLKESIIDNQGKLDNAKKKILFIHRLSPDQIYMRNTRTCQ